MFTQGDKDSLLSFGDGTKPKASGPATGTAAKTSTLSSASASGGTSAQGVNAEGMIYSLLLLTIAALPVISNNLLIYFFKAGVMPMVSGSIA